MNTVTTKNTQSGSKYQQRKNQQPRQAQPESAVVAKLKSELAEAKKGQDNLQTLSEIKYLKGRISSLEKTVQGHLAQIVNLMNALENVKVPSALVTKIAKGEKITIDDVNELPMLLTGLITPNEE